MAQLSTPTFLSPDPTQSHQSCLNRRESAWCAAWVKMGGPIAPSSAFCRSCHSVTGVPGCA
eukprot:4514245-Amphidinium_carterae.1